MNFLNRTIPPYFYRKSNLVLLVLFTSAFALLFINVYKPFSSSDWYPISTFEYFLYSSLITLTGVGVVVISRLVMYYFTKQHSLHYWQYGIWILAEIFFMSLFYTYYSYTLDATRDGWEVYRSSVTNTSLVLLLPYSFSMLFFSQQEKSRQLKALAAGLPLNSDTPKADIISFYDEKGELKLSLQKNTLLYLESADNYVSIWFTGKTGTENYLLRNTLKEIEGRFTHTHIVRCHRSFMVNLDQVKVARRTKDGILLDFGVPKVPEIPVSKTYGEQITQWFASLMH